MTPPNWALISLTRDKSITARNVRDSPNYICKHVNVYKYYLLACTHGEKEWGGTRGGNRREIE